MSNTIELVASIKFGKFKGARAVKLLQANRSDFKSYIKWLWENTDIPVDSRITVQLQAEGFINLGAKRHNSLNPSSIMVDVCQGGNLLRVNPDYRINEQATENFKRNIETAREVMRKHFEPQQFRASSTHEQFVRSMQMLIKADSV